MALVGVELETLVSDPDALTSRPPCTKLFYNRQMVDVHKQVDDLSHLEKAFLRLALSCRGSKYSCTSAVA